MSKRINGKMILAVCYGLVFYLVNIMVSLIEQIPGKIIHRVFKSIAYLNHISLVPSFRVWPIACASGVVLFLYLRGKMKKTNFRDGEEHGSARWSKSSEIRSLMDKDSDQNIILTASEGIKLKSKTKKWWTERNKNVLVIGGSGSGKTRFYVKPNLMQLHSSYVVTDPKGTLITETGRMFAKAKYDIKTFNTVNFSKSMKYNPFEYIKDQKDILKLVEVIMANTTSEQEKADFWTKAERLYYTALIAYIYYEADESEKHFGTLLDMIRMSQTSEEDENFTNPVDELFEELKVRDPDHFALRQYQSYKLAAGKTAKSILISCAVRLAPFDIDSVREVMLYDELELDTLGDRRQILYLIMSDTDDTFNFLIAMIYTQMFNLLCTKADDVYHGRLPVPVRCILDEFANTGKIPNFTKLIATIRSRGISADVILQAESQMKERYKDSLDTIIGNCDSILFLGGSERGTRKNLVEELGKQTIDTVNMNQSSGREKSTGYNYNKLARDLKSFDELGVMDRRKCILRITGLRPFFSDKYDITKHRRYRELADYDERNRFDINRYLKRHEVNITQIKEIIRVDQEQIKEKFYGI